MKSQCGQVPSGENGDVTPSCLSQSQRGPVSQGVGRPSRTEALYREERHYCHPAVLVLLDPRLWTVSTHISFVLENFAFTWLLVSFPHLRQIAQNGCKGKMVREECSHIAIFLEFPREAGFHRIGICLLGAIRGPVGKMAVTATDRKETFQRGSKSPLPIP